MGSPSPNTKLLIEALEEELEELEERALEQIDYHDEEDRPW